MAEGSRIAGTSERKAAEGSAAGEAAVSNREAAVASTAAVVADSTAVAADSTAAVVVVVDSTVVADMVVVAIAKA
jgi:hypothetical protein